MTTMTCATMREMAAELALDLLDGKERAGALAHLETCPACQREVTLLTNAADELLLLAPSVEPSPGFEQRVLASIATLSEAEHAVPTRSRFHAARLQARRPRVLMAAAAVLMVFALGVGVIATRSTGSDASTLTAAMVTTTGRPVGLVELGGSPASLTVTLDDWAGLVHSYGATVDAPYWLSVRTSDGASDLYRLPSADGHTWTIGLDTPPSSVVTVSMVDNHGTVWCSAEFIS